MSLLICRLSVVLHSIITFVTNFFDPCRVPIAGLPVAVQTNGLSGHNNRAGWGRVGTYIAPLMGSLDERRKRMGHQHDKEPVHDQGKGHSHKGGEHAGDKDDQAGGGRREHRASGSHESNISGTHNHDSSSSTSGGGSSGGGGGSHGGGHKQGG
jgi:uncharacterized membrane protein YgcG